MVWGIYTSHAEFSVRINGWQLDNESTALHCFARIYHMVVHTYPTLPFFVFVILHIHKYIRIYIHTNHSFRKFRRFYMYGGETENFPSLSRSVPCAVFTTKETGFFSRMEKEHMNLVPSTNLRGIPVVKNKTHCKVAVYRTLYVR